MIKADYFENTNKSILNISSEILYLLKKNEIDLDKLIYKIQNQLVVSYDKIILTLNYLYILDAISYDCNSNIIRKK